MKSKFLLLLVILNNVIISQENYKAWLKSERAKFQSYLSAEDSNFVNFLKQDWKEYKLNSGLKSEEKPKPVEPPIFKNIEKKNPNESIEKVQTHVPYINAAEKVSINEDTKEQDINFLSLKIKIKIPSNIKYNSSNKLDKNEIAEFWRHTSSINYNSLLEQLKLIREELNLNDWGYFNLIKNVSQIVYPDLKEMRSLFVCYFMSKSGYNVKVSLIEDKIYLLINSTNMLYNVPYFTNEKGEKTYVIDIDNIGNLNEGKIYTYENNYPGAEKPIDFYVSKEITASGNTIEKKFHFSYNGNDYQITALINKDLIEFYKDYPQTELPVYFNSTKSRLVKNTLLKNLKNVIEGKSEIEAVNILLRFIQTAFDYKTDLEYFKREKPLFVEETLYYPYSDCEDRAILFSYLVKNLLGLEVIGIDYPSHVSTAVLLRENINGKTIEYKGKKYTICDPTYIGAPAGECMPQYANSEFKIIEIK